MAGTNDQVLIKHPDMEGTGSVPRRKLPFWEKKGFKEVVVDDESGDVTELPSNDDLSKASRAELEEVATARGIDHSQFSTKAELLSALTGEGA